MKPSQQQLSSFKPPARREADDTRAWYQEALTLCRANRLERALAVLENGLTYDLGSPSPAMFNRLRSYYGLCLALVRGEVDRGRMLCEEALTQSSWDVELYMNLAQIYLLGNRRDLATEALRTAQIVHPNSNEVKSMIDKLGARRDPVFRFLDRRHPVNKYVGLLRHRLADARRAMLS